MIKKLFKFLALSLAIFTLFTGTAHAEWWAKQANGQLYTNGGNGLGNSIINVAGCNGCGGGGGGGVTSVGLTTGTSGTNVNVTGSPITGAGSFTLNIPIASGTNTGKLSSTDWSTFNSKVGTGLLTGSGLTMNTDRLLGRSTAGVGAVEELTLGTGLTLSGGVLSTSAGTITGSGLNTQITYWTGASTIAGSTAFTWNNATGRFQITNGASPAKRAFLVDAPTFDVAMGDISSGGNNTSLYVGDSSQNIQFLGGDGLGGTGAVLDIYTNLSVGNGAIVNMGDVSGLVNSTILSVNDQIQQINMSGAPIGRMFRLDFAAGDALFGDFSLGTSGTDNVGSIQIGASGTFLMYGVDGLGTLSPFFASLGGGDYSWGDINGVGSGSTLSFFESSGGVWSFNQPNLQFGGIDYRFPNAQGAKGQALVLSDGVGTLQYENVQRSWFEQTQSVTVAGTTTPTSVFGTGQGTRVIAANTVQVGSQYEIEIYGYYVAAVAQTLDYKIEMMGLSLSPGVTPIPPATVTNSAFRAKFTMTVRTLGASGQAILDGYVKFDNNNGTNVTYEFNSTSIHTIDTTSAHTNDFVPNWSSNSGSNSLTVLEASIKQTR